MDSAFLVSAFVTLFVVMDPIGTTPVFIALTRGMAPARRRAIAVRACLVALGVLLLFAFLGEAVLDFVGITMPAFRIAGGLLLFLTALDMLFERRNKRRASTAEEAEEEDDDPDSDPSVFPMAIPLLAGPGAITTIILLVGRAGDAAGTAAVLGVMSSVLLIALVLLLASNLIERALGGIGITVLTRLFGLLLAALSVQFVADGLIAFGFGTPPG
ncbi:inner membrane protein [Roseivivax jejudonensis]|uniref:UPF0056 membrane protein n=1 Tax=Roseivivax jejudonensis TaxID=1529041 RepID=A0A1X6YSF4_9RHOB|nr:MarC family protein [Roseivivax jejudonensis]SLN29778.1 inner membrane protein [Roseivivax jejudonensis]